jgi:HEAT repeat protein
MADVVPEARKRLIALGDPAFGRALERVGTRNGLELRAVQEVLSAFGERSIPPLVAMLRDEDRRRRAGAAVLLADLEARTAATKIVPLLGEDKTKLGALDALARLGVHETWEGVAPLLTDGKERVRVSALRCLQRLDAREAVGLVAGRLSRTEIFTVRFAAEDVLVGFGDAAVPILLDLARQDKDLTVRRHAVRALGRTTPARAYDLLVELAGHEDWRIRFDAAGALAAYAPARDFLREWRAHEQHPYVRARLGRELRSE